MLYPKLTSNLYFTSSVDDILICEPSLSSKNSSTSSCQPVTHSYILESRLIKISSSSSTRSTSNSTSALLCQHARTYSSTSENLPSSPSDNPISLRLSFVIEASFIVNTYRKSTNLLEDQDFISSLRAINPTDLLYHTLEEIEGLLHLIFTITH